MLFENGLQRINILHLKLSQELLELIGLFDVVENLLIVVKSVPLVVQHAEMPPGIVRILMEPQHQLGYGIPLTVERLPVANKFVDDRRDLRNDVAPVLLGDVIKGSVDLGIEQVIAQIVAEKFENIEELGIDVPGIAGDVGLLPENAVLVREDAPLVDHRKKVGFAGFQGSVELIKPLVDVLPL